MPDYRFKRERAPISATIGWPSTISWYTTPRRRKVPDQWPICCNTWSQICAAMKLRLIPLETHFGRDSGMLGTSTLAPSLRIMVLLCALLYNIIIFKYGTSWTKKALYNTASYHVRRHDRSCCPFCTTGRWIDDMGLHYTGSSKQDTKLDENGLWQKFWKWIRGENE